MTFRLAPTDQEKRAHTIGYARCKACGWAVTREDVQEAAAAANVHRLTCVLVRELRSAPARRIA